MPVDPLLTPLLTPLRLGATQLRNRIVVTGHATRNVDAERLPNDDDVAYFAARARGGAAMVTMGTAAVHPSSPTPYGIYANIDDRIVPRYEALSAAVHEHGALICAQLGHMGARAEGAPGGVWAPSRVSHHNHGSYPHVMDDGEIGALVDAFAAAASRAVRGGLDGVEIAVGHGQMINLFLSPLTNTRTDGWGGDDERRFRFCREVLQAVRDSIGDALLVVRVNGSDEVTGSLDEDAWLDIDQRISEEHLADAVNVSVGFGGSVIPTMVAGHGCYLHYAHAVRKRVSLPVGAVGRIVSPQEAAQSLAAGDADFFGMTRAHIADPDVVRKFSEGREREIRPCIGCLQMCQGELERNQNVKCVYNAVTGRERYVDGLETRPAVTARRVTVVGGGPAGLEVARVAARRGHAVTVLERSTQLGGSVRLAQRTPGRAELGVSVDWLASEVRRLGVTVRTDQVATADTVSDTAPDVVVLATGARTTAPPWSLGCPERVVGVREVIGGTVDPRGTVLVVDDEHRSQALSAAIVLAERGCTVTYLTDRTGPAELMEEAVRNDLLLALRGRPFTIHASRRVLSLHPDAGRVRVRTEEAALHKLVFAVTTTTETEEFEADWVVSTFVEPDDELFAQLRGRHDVRMVGDVLNPHRIEGAVHGGFALATGL
jgi:2,4-dienoyl-CoA reductase-like NADH-dependent reductase (Old Yellow Enzyme family)/thioredoxin reductase